MFCHWLLLKTSLHLFFASYSWNVLLDLQIWQIYEHFQITLFNIFPKREGSVSVIFAIFHIVFWTLLVEMKIPDGFEAIWVPAIASGEATWPKVFHILRITEEWVSQDLVALRARGWVCEPAEMALWATDGVWAMHVRPKGCLLHSPDSRPAILK